MADPEKATIGYAEGEYQRLDLLSDQLLTTVCKGYNSVPMRQCVLEGCVCALWIRDLLFMRSAYMIVVRNNKEAQTRYTHC